MSRTGVRPRPRLRPRTHTPPKTALKPRPIYKVNVGVVVHYADNGVNMGHYKWPTNIKEPEALRIVLAALPDEELSEVTHIQFSQTQNPNNTNLGSRIRWLDQEPHGKYVLNADLHGDYGVLYEQDQAQRQANVTYNPDVV